MLPCKKCRPARYVQKQSVTLLEGLIASLIFLLLSLKHTLISLQKAKTLPQSPEIRTRVGHSIRFIWIQFVSLELFEQTEYLNLDHSSEMNFVLFVPESRISTSLLLMQTSLGTIVQDKVSANGASSKPKTFKS